MKHKRLRKKVSVIKDPNAFHEDLKNLFSVPEFKHFYQEYILHNNDYDLSIMYFISFFTLFIQTGKSDESFEKLKIIMSNSETRSKIIKMFGGFGKQIYKDMNLLEE
jgi:hypothetical protein